MEAVKENIEKYVANKMSAAEKAEMESLIQSDPKVANEVQLQKLITTSIKKNRIAALKARLNKIPVSGSTMQVSTSSTFTAMKAASVILASAGLSLGVYFYIQNNESEKQVLSTESTSNELVKSDLPKLPEEKVAVISSKDVVAESSESVAEPAAELKKAEKKPIAIFKPKKQGKKVPNMESFDDDSEASVKSDIKDVNSASKSIESKLVSSDVDIKNIQDGSHKFHYKLQDNVLYLYGNFEASPYEILEFNRKTESQVLYLFYDKSYFAMTPTVNNEINKLKKVTDSKLLSDLENARSR
jgi:hypothetical protein